LPYWKYQRGATALYDMARDPGQTRNIAGANPVLVRKLATLTAQLATCSGAGCRRLENQGLQ
jgi:hypothetical protein